MLLNKKGARMSRVRRGRGDGSIYRVTRQRKDGTTWLRWAGQVTVGYTVDGKQRRATAYGDTKTEVREKLRELQNQVSTGSYSHSRVTTADYLSGWLDVKKHEVKARTHQHYADTARLYILPYLGPIELRKLTATDIERMMIKIAETTSADAANKARTLLMTAFNRAVKQGIIHRNPAKSVAKFKTEKRAIQPWTREETATFLDNAKPHRLFAAFYLALSTGMRHGEILGLHWEDIDANVITVQRSLITVRGAQVELSTPKTSNSMRRIYIDEATAQVLNHHKKAQEKEAKQAGEAWEDSGFVFTNQLGGPLIPRNFDTIWYRLRDLAGVPKISFHDLRHTHVSLLISRGVDPKTVAERVGHRDAAFTLRQYSHAFEEQRKKAGIGIEELLRD